MSKIEEQEATVIFSLTGNSIDLLSLKNISKKIENDLRDIDGISQIKVSGFPDEEIEIAVNDKKLIEYELTFAEISKAIKSSNILISGGNIMDIRGKRIDLAKADPIAPAPEDFAFGGITTPDLATVGGAKVPPIDTETGDKIKYKKKNYKKKKLKNKKKKKNKNIRISKHL